LEKWHSIVLAKPGPKSFLRGIIPAAFRGLGTQLNENETRNQSNYGMKIFYIAFYITF
jgi:hypothetical protein